MIFGFCPKILGKWQEPMNGILSVCECSLVDSLLIVGGNIQTLITMIQIV